MWYHCMCSDILVIVRSRGDCMQVSELTEVQREFYEERAGILEYEANMPRAMAEEIAMEQTKEYFHVLCI